MLSLPSDECFSVPSSFFLLEDCAEQNDEEFFGC